MATRLQQLIASRSTEASENQKLGSELQKLISKRNDDGSVQAQRELLEGVRDNRIENTRETSKGFLQLLNNGGGIGAAIGFGFTAAKAEVAELNNSRIDDAKARLEELRAERNDNRDENQRLIGNTLAAGELKLRGEKIKSDSISEQLSFENESQRIKISKEAGERAGRSLDIQARQAEVNEKLLVLSADEAVVEASNRVADLFPRSTRVSKLESKKIVDGVVKTVDDARDSGFLGAADRSGTALVSSLPSLIQNIHKLDKQDLVNLDDSLKSDVLLLKKRISDIEERGALSAEVRSAKDLINLYEATLLDQFESPETEEQAKAKAELDALEKRANAIRGVLQ